MPAPDPTKYQQARRARLRAKGVLPAPKPAKWHDAHPVTSPVGVPDVVKAYLATPEGRQAVLGLALHAQATGGLYNELA